MATVDATAAMRKVERMDGMCQNTWGRAMLDVDLTGVGEGPVYRFSIPSLMSHLIDCAFPNVFTPQICHLMKISHIGGNSLMKLTKNRIGKKGGEPR